MYNENYDYDSQGNLWKKGTVGSETVYTYLDGAHMHAVTHLGGTPMYSYDPNGNMTTRTVGTTTYTQGWDAENRLVSVCGTGLSASFTYDGDGTRVKGTVNGTVTAYVSNWFEWTGSTSTMKKYYYAGSQRIAMRTGSGTATSGLLWMIGDHLGSTTKIANADGTINSQRRYRPWGEARYGGTMSTTFAFTGQRQEVQLGGTDGLYYYGARWYDAALGRWLSPDSIIPEAAQGVQAWSRYTYVNNAPTRYQDPTGHTVDCGVAKLGCEGGKYKRSQTPPDPSKQEETPNPSPIKPQQEEKDVVALPSPSDIAQEDLKNQNITLEGDKTGQILAGIFLIVVTDLFVGIPAAAVIVLTGGVTPPALAAEALELLVVLPITILGVSLIVDAISEE